MLIAGAGLAGLTAAIAFARAGFDVVACGADERGRRGRTVAMLDRSIAYLEQLGLRAAVEPQAAPMRALRMIDDTGGLFPPRPVEFLCSRDRPRRVRLERRERPDGRRARRARRRDRRN